MTENPQVRIPKVTKEAADAQAEATGQDIGDVIEGWRRDAEMLHALKETDFKDLMQTRGDAGP